MIGFFVSRTFFWLVVLGMYLNLLLSSDAPRAAPFYAINFAIVVFSTVALVGSSSPSYSSYRSVSMFSLILFGVTPLFEFQGGLTYQYHDLSIFDEYAATSAIVLLGMVCFFLGYKIKPKPKPINHKFLIKNPIFLVLYSALCGFLILSYNSFSLISLFVRGGDFDQTVGGSPFDAMFLVVIFPVPMCALMAYLAFSERRDPTILWLLVLLALFFNFPTGMPRFLSAALYLSAIFLYKPSLFRSKLTLPVSSFFAIFIIFPFIGSFRNLTSFSNIEIFFGYDILTAGAFDAFQNFVLTREFIDVSYGYQALGALLFFVPRAFWPGKPVDSGTLLGTEVGFPHLNIALNFLGEGYINFGILGVLLFGLALGVFCSRLDNKLERSEFWYPSAYLFAVAFPALSFFVMRGGLLSAVAYCSGLFVCFVVISALFVRRARL